MNTITDFDKECYLRRAVLRIAMTRDDETWFAEQSQRCMRRIWRGSTEPGPQGYADFWADRALEFPDRQDICLKLSEMWWKYGKWTGEIVGSTENDEIEVF